VAANARRGTQRINAEIGDDAEVVVALAVAEQERAELRSWVVGVEHIAGRAGIIGISASARRHSAPS
jgi:hypothetical protein